MKLTKDMSIRLTFICLFIFAAVLFVADLTAFRWIHWYIEWRGMLRRQFAWLIAVFYAASVAGWICLWALRKLLCSIRAGQVFCEGNVNTLRCISLCCAAAAVVFIAGGFVYGPLFIPAVAAAFMTLIVRVVENVFRQANEMKSELDLTI